MVYLIYLVLFFWCVLLAFSNEAFLIILVVSICTVVMFDVIRIFSVSFLRDWLFVRIRYFIFLPLKLRLKRFLNKRRGVNKQKGGKLN